MPIPGYMRVQSNLRGLVTTPSLSSFLPSDISGLKLWLAADRSTLWQNSARTTPAVADADPVGAWDDLSGNGNHATQATGSRRPTLRLNVQNGKSVTRLDGVDDLLSVSMAVPLPLTIFIAAKITSDGSTQVSFFDSNANRLLTFVQISSPRLEPFTGVAMPYNLSFPTNFFTFSLRTQATGGSEFRYDRITRVTNTNSSARDISSSMILGADTASARNCSVDFCEVCVFNSWVSESDLRRVESYLSAKWGTP